MFIHIPFTGIVRISDTARDRRVLRFFHTQLKSIPSHELTIQHAVDTLRLAVLINKSARLRMMEADCRKLRKDLNVQIELLIDTYGCPPDLMTEETIKN